MNRVGRPPGRGLIARAPAHVYKRPSADSKDAIMLRTRAKRVAAQFVEKNYAAHAGGLGTDDRVTNQRPRKPRAR